MKYSFAYLLVALVFFVSCSSDDRASVEAQPDSNALIGSWNFTELDITGVESPNEILLAQDIIDELLSDGCEILVFTFNADKTVIAESKDFTETGVDVSPDLSGLLVECPENTQTESSIWSLEGDQLTFINADGENETITIELDGNTLVIPGESLNAENLTDTKLVLTRR